MTNSVLRCLRTLPMGRCLPQSAAGAALIRRDATTDGLMRNAVKPLRERHADAATTRAQRVTNTPTTGAISTREDNPSSGFANASGRMPSPQTVQSTATNGDHQ